MKNENNIQKKKTPLKIFLDTLFKILIAIAVIIFIYIAYKNMNFSKNTVNFASKKEQKEEYTPSKLKWSDPFKGVENVPNKNQKEKKSSQGAGGTGFNFQGFNK